jgi:hypothetical protein
MTKLFTEYDASDKSMLFIEIKLILTDALLKMMNITISTHTTSNPKPIMRRRTEASIVYTLHERKPTTNIEHKISTSSKTTMNNDHDIQNIHNDMLMFKLISTNDELTDATKKYRIQSTTIRLTLTTNTIDLAKHLIPSANGWSKPYKPIMDGPDLT